MPSLMKERPILFSAPMVRAILEGRKTQTRRVVKPQPYVDAMGNACWNGWNFGQSASGKPHIQQLASPIPGSKTKRVHCPYGKPGDRLWVRETWAVNPYTPEVRYRATDELWTDAGPLCWRPSIHMPRDCCRIRLEIVSVRVERLNDISEADALAEGVSTGDWITRRFQAGPMSCDESKNAGSAREAYAALWEQINGAGSWADNPWVWCVEFKRVTP